MNCLLYGVGYKYVQEHTFEKHDLHNLDYSKTIEIKTDLAGSEYSCPRYWNRAISAYSDKKSITGTYEIFTEIEDSELKSKMQPSMFGMNKHYNIFYINFHTIKDEISTKKTSWGNLTSFLAKHIKKIVDNDSSMINCQETYEEELETATQKVIENSSLEKFIHTIKKNYSANLRDNNCEISFGLPDYEDIFLQMIFKIGLNGDSNKLVPIDQFGDGYISMFVMAVIQAIAESNTDDKCLFLFEEPESFLHENHQEYFYKRVLCTLAEKGHQVIYTTHSDKMIDIFEPEGIIRIEFDESTKQTVKKYNDTGEFSPSLPTDEDGNELISYENYNSYIKSVEPNLNKLLFSRKAILVEGPNDLIAYTTAIEKEVFRLTGDQKLAETYLSFLNIVILVHHGKITATLLVELCKRFNLDYFVINDWDLDTDFIEELSNFDNEDNMKGSELYQKDGEQDRTRTSKGMVTTNWKLINCAGKDKIHFNIPKLEAVLDYPSTDKNSLKIYNLVKNMKSYGANFFPDKLRNYLEFSDLETANEHGESE